MYQERRWGGGVVVVESGGSPISYPLKGINPSGDNT